MVVAELPNRERIRFGIWEYSIRRKLHSKRTFTFPSTSPMTWLVVSHSKRARLARQSKLLIWSDSTTPETVPPGGRPTSNG